MDMLQNQHDILMVDTELNHFAGNTIANLHKTLLRFFGLGVTS